MLRRRLHWLLVCSGLAAAGISASIAALIVDSSIRSAVRNVYYEHLLGTPLIKEVPRMPIQCNSIITDKAMVALVIGQSNAANFSNKRNVPGGSIYNFYRGRCYVAIDPLAGADGEGGSVWMIMANSMIAMRYYSSVILVPSAVGGSSVSRWSPGGDLHLRLMQTVKDLRGAGLSPTHVFWHQGETDAMLRTPSDKYLYHLDAMIDSLRAEGVRAPVYVSIATYCKGSTSEQVRQAQIAAKSAVRNVLQGVDSDRFVDARYRHDDCHLSELGANMLASDWVHILAPRGPAIP